MSQKFEFCSFVCTDTFAACPTHVTIPFESIKYNIFFIIMTSSSSVVATTSNEYEILFVTNYNTLVIHLYIYIQGILYVITSHKACRHCLLINVTAAPAGPQELVVTARVAGG